MKRIVVEFEETYRIVRTVVCEIEDDTDINFENYVHTSDDLEDIVDRIKDDGIAVLDVSDLFSDLEISSNAEIKYHDNREMEEGEECGLIYNCAHLKHD